MKKRKIQTITSFFRPKAPEAEAETVDNNNNEAIPSTSNSSETTVGADFVNGVEGSVAEAAAAMVGPVENSLAGSAAEAAAAMVGLVENSLHVSVAEAATAPVRPVESGMDDSVADAAAAPVAPVESVVDGREEGENDPQPSTSSTNSTDQQKLGDISFCVNIPLKHIPDNVRASIISSDNCINYLNNSGGHIISSSRDNQKRSLLVRHLSSHKWAVYSERHEGVYCKMCVMTSRKFGGRNSEMLTSFVGAPLKEYKVMPFPKKNSSPIYCSGMKWNNMESLSKLCVLLCFCIFRTSSGA
jgi:hypothetical protein